MHDQQFNVSSTAPGPNVRSTEVVYFTKDQLNAMIESSVGQSVSGLGWAIATYGYSRIKSILAAKLPPQVAGFLSLAVLVVSTVKLIEQIASFTDENRLEEILHLLVDHSGTYARVKVTVTTWEKLVVNPTNSYWTYYTTTSYEAVA
ncbi:hypothetical protein [Paenibacillus zanthoxyli]|uniref:hypothetical protein n=1 Tax=Paenibacillus zanthoxyli TaxID=369399 RepID=UPI000472A9E4|nr:hypothetical protein [Paenibacillus zanthoxyli]